VDVWGQVVTSMVVVVRALNRLRPYKYIVIMMSEGYCSATFADGSGTDVWECW